ncbi:MAG: hypothetical protein H0U98_01065 [Alphaproteobacteria bacterium]|nr:hypothetical protein [Alphaproteobacteria bacterium]
MTRDNPLDFNDASEPFRCLGDKVDIAVEDAAEVIGSTNDKTEHALAGLRVARLAMARIANRDASTPQVTAALLDIMEALAEAETIVKASRPLNVGREREPLEPQACAVVAFEWLQKLNNLPLDRQSAFSLVAAAIPADLLQAKPGQYGRRLTPAEQLDAWRDAFGRKHNAPQRAALANVRLGMSEFYRCWHEPVGTLPNGAIKYSADWKQSDHLDLSSQQVLEWLREALRHSNE